MLELKELIPGKKYQCDNGEVIEYKGINNEWLEGKVLTGYNKGEDWGCLEADFGKNNYINWNWRIVKEAIGINEAITNTFTEKTTKESEGCKCDIKILATYGCQCVGVKKYDEFQALKEVFGGKQ